jgi:hypothetical protein
MGAAARERRQAPRGAWPLLGVGFCLSIAVYSVPNFDLTTNILGAGSIAIGIVPYLWSRRTAPGRVPSMG